MVVELPALARESVFVDLSAEVPHAVRSRSLPGARVLVDVDPSARRSGLFAGMSETEAKARCPRLVVRERDDAKEQDRLQSAADVLVRFTPLCRDPTAVFFGPRDDRQR
ncbi:MAG: hypothetical protein HC923_09055 [Myxococcales bacterium]|nr:hypothetical protein [Myxococcales bacterium]